MIPGEMQSFYESFYQLILLVNKKTNKKEQISLDLKNQKKFFLKKNKENKNMEIRKISKKLMHLQDNRITRSQQNFCKDKTLLNTVNSISSVSNRIQSCYVKTIASKKKEN